VEMNFFNDTTKTKTEVVIAAYDLSKDLSANICSIMQRCGF